MAKTNVALLFGGRSSEHSVSCVTARAVYESIDSERFTVVPVGITQDGAFVRVSEAELLSFTLDPAALPAVEGTGERVLWPFVKGEKTLRFLDSAGNVSGSVDVACVLPMLHGPWGEDGTVQGLLELVDMPYTGSGVLGSALAMDKHMVKVVLQESGIAVAPWRTVTFSQWRERAGDATGFDAGLSYPLFVKPARAGSSIGVSRVTEFTGLAAALDTAFKEDQSVLIESGVTGREVEIGILQGRNGEKPRASKVIGEIVFTGRDFYDFESKYLGAPGADVVMPAEVTDAEYQSLKDAAIKAFEAVQLAGYSRVDFFLTETGPVLNEINTLPGFTPFSMFPKLWEESGLSYRDLITELIELALTTKRSPGAAN